jgi:hypothetical protein
MQPAEVVEPESFAADAGVMSGNAVAAAAADVVDRHWMRGCMLGAGAWKQETVSGRDRYSWQPVEALLDTFCLAFVGHQQPMPEGLYSRIAEGFALQALGQAQGRILGAGVSLVAYIALGGSAPAGDWILREGLGGSRLGPWGVAWGLAGDLGRRSSQLEGVAAEGDAFQKR